MNGVLLVQIMVKLKALYKKEKLDKTYLKIFGCLGFLYIPKNKIKKLDTKVVKCFLIGYDENSKAYKVYLLDQRKIVVSKDLRFDQIKVEIFHAHGFDHSLKNWFDLRTKELQSELGSEDSTIIDIREDHMGFPPRPSISEDENEGVAYD